MFKKRDFQMANKSELNHIKFFNTAESRLYIEDSSRKTDSVFNQVYDNFFYELNESLQSSKITTQEIKNNQGNNIYAFVGERGTGKTSCMLSVATMLNENENKPISSNGEFKECKFEVLPSIDPSFFDANTNILDIFLGQLFSSFKKKYENDQNDIKSGEKQDVLSAFESVKNTLSFMNSKKCEQGNYISECDNVDRLMNLSASVDLANSIGELINQYLKVNKKTIP